MKREFYHYQILKEGENTPGRPDGLDGRYNLSRIDVKNVMHYRLILGLICVIIILFSLSLKGSFKNHSK